jgi:hypothetical protein
MLSGTTRFVRAKSHCRRQLGCSKSLFTNIICIFIVLLLIVWLTYPNYLHETNSNTLNA